MFRGFKLLWISSGFVQYVKNSVLSSLRNSSKIETLLSSNGDRNILRQLLTQVWFNQERFVWNRLL
jgi:CRISPR-associated protein Cas8b1/Cst1 subtype I-B